MRKVDTSRISVAVVVRAVRMAAAIKVSISGGAQVFPNAPGRFMNFLTVTNVRFVRAVTMLAIKVICATLPARISAILVTLGLNGK